MVKPRSPVPPAELVSEVAREAAEPASPLLRALVDPLRERFGGSLAAVLLYGSTLHGRDVADGLVDLYALVDDYASAYPRVRRLRWFNRWIPPNVFYREAEADGVRLRSKYAVLSLEHFERGCTEWFHSYLWGRFAQPTRLVHARDPDAAARVQVALAGAVLRMLREGVSATDRAEADAAELWADALERSYAAELRPEKGDRAHHLVGRHRATYERFTAAAAPALAGVLETGDEGRYRITSDRSERRGARRRWALRRFQGRFLSLLRLSKALFTFEGGVDYLAWKIERHTGEPVEVTPRLRRHPLIFGWGPLWRLLRRGVLR